jgi:hypothetical protein
MNSAVMILLMSLHSTIEMGQYLCTGKQHREKLSPCWEIIMSVDLFFILSEIFATICSKWKTYSFQSLIWRFIINKLMTC